MKFGFLFTLVFINLISSPEFVKAEKVFVCRKEVSSVLVFTNRPVQSPGSSCRDHKIQRSSFNKLKSENFGRFKPDHFKFSLRKKIAELKKDPPALNKKDSKKLIALRRELENYLH